jgi:hypothetical protein
MKHLNIKMTLASLAISAAALLPTTLQAQNPYAVIAGSSALYNTLAFTAFELNSDGGYLCGSNHWSFAGTGVGTSTEISIHDSRSSSIVNEPATVWISWNADEVATPKGPNPRTCIFLQVDSTVGVRAALARTSSGTPAASVFINSSLVGVAGANKVPNATITTEPALPQAVYNTLNGALITVAASDIRPEDTKFATVRALSALGTTQAGSTILTNVTGLGYNNPSTPGIGYPIKSSQASTVANPVDFALIGNDPISNGPAASYYKVYNIGAGPVLVIVNTTNTATGHLGDATLTDISSRALAFFLDGTYSRNTDLFTNYTPGTLTASGVSTFIREPLSGTMNTVEFNVPNTLRYFTSQEKGVTGGLAATTLVVGSTQNPLSLYNPNGFGGRYRAIGTGQEITAVKTHADSLGYAFWSYGNFNGILPATARYLTVDGVDPLYASYSGGTFPQKAADGTYPPISFPNIQNGSYPIWTVFHLVSVPEADSDAVKNFVHYADGAAANFSDFVSFSSLNVFHSHFYTVSFPPDNGHLSYPGPAGSYNAPFYGESGGDVGGAVLSIQADLDYITDSVAAGSGIKQLVNFHK